MLLTGIGLHVHAGHRIQDLGGMVGGHLRNQLPPQHRAGARPVEVPVPENFNHVQPDRVQCRLAAQLGATRLGTGLDPEGPVAFRDIRGRLGPHHSRQTQNPEDSNQLEPGQFHPKNSP